MHPRKAKNPGRARCCKNEEALTTSGVGILTARKEAKQPQAASAIRESANCRSAELQGATRTDSVDCYLLSRCDAALAMIYSRLFAAQIALGCVMLLAASAVRAQSITPSLPIIVLGRALGLPSGTPVYGETVIDAGRLRTEASGRVEDVVRDVAGFSAFRRSDSRSANPSGQVANFRAWGYGREPDAGPSRRRAHGRSLFQFHPL